MMSPVLSISIIEWLGRDRWPRKIMPSLGRGSGIITMCLLLTSATLRCMEITVKRQAHLKIKGYR